MTPGGTNARPCTRIASGENTSPNSVDSLVAFAAFACLQYLSPPQHLRCHELGDKRLYSLILCAASLRRIVHMPALHPAPQSPLPWRAPSEAANRAQSGADPVVSAGCFPASRTWRTGPSRRNTTRRAVQSPSLLLLLAGNRLDSPCSRVHSSNSFSRSLSTVGFTDSVALLSCSIVTCCATSALLSP